MTAWKSRVSAQSINLLAPQWYLALKAKGASREQLLEAVKAFCIKTMPHEEIDDVIVGLMIASYEA